MSWIIQSTLNKRIEIKTKPDLESDEYNDLLLIEKAIEELGLKGVLSADDMGIINFFSEGKLPADAKELDKYRTTVVGRYDMICERIAFYLGGYFTNDGYIDYMVEKYNLTEEQENKLREFIRSKYKHRIMRNPFNE
jgi:hypothetical protein